jgi:hypothetical protein
MKTRIILGYILYTIYGEMLETTDIYYKVIFCYFYILFNDAYLEIMVAKCKVIRLFLLRDAGLFVVSSFSGSRIKYLHDFW